MLVPQRKFPFSWSTIINWVLWALVIYFMAQKIPVWWGNFQAAGQAAGDVEVLELASLETKTIPSSPEQPAVIVFWATWCGPCHLELSRIQKAVEEKTLPDDRIFAVSIGEPIEDVQQFVKDKNYTFPIYVDSQQVSLQSYGVKGTPTIYHLQNGKILWTTTGVNPLSISKAESLFKK